MSRVKISSLEPSENKTGTKDFAGVLEKIPVEIWTKIFDIVKHFGNKDVAALRQTCSLFRDVIDNHVELHVVLNYNITTGPARIRHVRAVSCTVKDCTKYIPLRLVVFKNPGAISQINLYGPISRLNFSRLVHITPNVETVTLQQGFLEMENFLNFGVENNEHPTLPTFWRRLKYLNIHSTKNPFYNDKDAINLRTILKSHLPTLKGLSFSLENDWNDMGSLIANFLVNNPNVKDVQTWSNSYFSFSNSAKNLQLQESIQLESLKMTFVEPYRFSHSIWRRILLNQKFLSRLEIHDFSKFCRSECCLRFEELIGMLKTNQATLTHLSLKLAHIPEIVNVSTFQNMTALKTLELQFIPAHGRISQEWSSKPRVVGLTFLPTNIERLELLGMYCNKQDMFELANNCMKNLRYLTIEVGPNSEIQPVILEGILRKRYLRKLTLGPINFSLFEKIYLEERLNMLVGTEFMVPVKDGLNFSRMFDVDLLNLRRKKGNVNYNIA